MPGDEVVVYKMFQPFLRFRNIILYGVMPIDRAVVSTLLEIPGLKHQADLHVHTAQFVSTLLEILEVGHSRGSICGHSCVSTLLEILGD